MKEKFCAAVTFGVTLGTAFALLWQILWPIGPTTSGWETVGRLTGTLLTLAALGAVETVALDVWNGAARE